MRLLILTVFASLFMLSTPAMATEEISYRVIETADKERAIEIRAYDDAVAAEVLISGKRRDAISNAFSILFDYIQGNNETSQSISMTTPVSQEASSQTITMTAPVSQEAAGNNQWRVAFYMPNDMTYETTPKPLDDRVTIHRVTGKKMAAITFSGRGSDDNMREHEAILRAYLAQHDIEHDETALYAFYDAPWVLWFLRRNEVLFKLQ